jgi:hypothetical protein
MRWLLELVDGPEIEVLELAQMKRELREFAGVTSRDTDITAKIQAAREWIEDYTGQVMVDETWRLSIERTGDMFTDYAVARRSLYGTVMPTRDVYLRRSPLLAITSVVTVDADGAETAVDAADYDLRDDTGKWPLLVPISTATWGSSNVRITFRAGYADRTGSPQQDASVVPERFKQAMILYTRWLYDLNDDHMKAAESVARPLRVSLGIA